MGRLLVLAHALAYRRARQHSSVLWWAVALAALLIARHEGVGEEREIIRVKPGQSLRVSVSRPTGD